MRFSNSNVGTNGPVNARKRLGQQDWQRRLARLVMVQGAHIYPIQDGGAAPVVLDPKDKKPVPLAQLVTKAHNSGYVTEIRSIAANGDTPASRQLVIAKQQKVAKAA